MHRQGETEHFDVCPICKGPAAEYKRVDVREGVWFTCCPACHGGMRAFFTLKASGRSPHPALGRRRRRRNP